METTKGNEIVEKLLEEGVSSSDVLTSKEVVIQVFDALRELNIEKSGKILFVLLNYVEKNAELFEESEIMQIFTTVTTRTEFINSFQFSKAVSDFIQFLALLNFVPFETIMEFSSSVIDNIQIESEQKYFAVSLISGLIQPLSNIGDNETIAKYRDIIMSIIPQLSDETFIRVVVDALVEIIDNGELEDEEFDSSLVTLINETENITLINAFWYSMSFINEEKVSDYLQISIPLFFSTLGSEISNSMFFFIASNAQYINFDSFVTEEQSLMHCIIELNSSFESMDDYNDELFAKTVKYALSFEHEFALLLEFVETVLQADSLSEVQCNMTFTIICAFLDNKGYLLLSKFDINSVFDFIEQNKESFFSDANTVSSINSFIASVSNYKEYISKEKTNELFGFLFANLSSVEDEALFHELCSFICHLVPLCTDIFDTVVSAIDDNEAIADILASVIKSMNTLQPQISIELMQKFCEIAQSDENLIQTCTSVICAVYSHSYFIEQCSAMFNEFIQEILSNISPDDDANFIISFLSNLIYALSSTGTLPEFDLSPLDSFIERGEELELYKLINNEIKKLEFLYSNEERRTALFRSNPLNFIELLESFPEMFSPRFIQDTEEVWTNIDFLVESNQVESVASFFKAMITNGNTCSIPSALKFFVELPAECDGCMLRASIILLATFMKINVPLNIIEEHLGFVNENFSLFLPFAISNGFIFSGLPEVNVQELSLCNAGAYLAALEFGEEQPQKELIEYALANIDECKGFEVFIVSVYLHFPTLIPQEHIVHILESYPQQMFARNLFDLFAKILTKEETEASLKAELTKKFLTLLMMNNTKLHAMNLSRRSIEEVIHQIDNELVEGCISQLPEISEALVALLSKQ